MCGLTVDSYLCRYQKRALLTVLVGVILGLQIFFFLVLCLALARWKPTSAPPRLPPISLIVCAHDDEPHLRKLVPLLLGQSYPDFEVIIVDDRSNDGTYDFLLDLTRDSRIKMVRITQTPDHIPGKKYALTLGIRAAKHEVILVTDADCQPDSAQWIQAMASHLQPQHDFVVGVSPYLRRRGFLNLFIRFESLITSIQMAGFALAGMPYMAVGRNLLYRKDVFLRSKGFNRHLQVTGGDDDLFLNENATRQNVAICLLPAALVMSEPQVRWRDFFTQKLRHLHAGKFYRPWHRLVLAVFALTFVISPWLGLAVAASGMPAALLVLWAMRWLAVIASLLVLTKGLKIRFEWWLVPVLDFVYSIYYLVAGSKALFTKKVRWKN